VVMHIIIVILRFFEWLILCWRNFYTKR